MISLLAAAIVSSMGAGPAPASLDHVKQTRVVTMPSSVSEAAPMSVAAGVEVPPEAVGRTSDASATGSSGFASASVDAPPAMTAESVEYWKIDEAPGD